MESDDGIGPGLSGTRQWPKRLLEPIGRVLRTGVPHATIDRLFVSQHVEDLRLIIACALIAIASLFIIGVGVSVVVVISNVGIHYPQAKDWGPFRGFWAFFGTALGVFGAVLAWAYQAGSQRLGVVDLFACEISTLCRVTTLVDTVRRAIEIFGRVLARGDGGPANAEFQTRHFISEENYFPVFENNTRDLESLEAHVVVNITAFYTYMKAVRDSTRSLMEMRAPRVPPVPGSQSASNSTALRLDAMRNVIYMMFLGLESARKAIDYLVEFEPDNAEQTIVILISELEAYGFLREQFLNESDDTYYQRLELREHEYRKLVPELCYRVEGKGSKKSSEWEPALRLVPKLKSRYEAAVKDLNAAARAASIA